MAIRRICRPVYRARVRLRRAGPLVLRAPLNRLAAHPHLAAALALADRRARQRPPDDLLTAPGLPAPGRRQPLRPGPGPGCRALGGIGPPALAALADAPLRAQHPG